MPPPVLEGYRDLVQIGRGGFGTVYRGWDEALERAVAVKILTGRLDTAAQVRFDRERRAMSRLSDHPNVVPVYRSGSTVDGQPYLVMPLLARGSTADDLAQRGPWAWPEVARTGVRLSGALETAHRVGVVHRDVKPANVLLSDYGEPLLTDFGIARVAGGFETESGVVTASISYAAPELLGGSPPTPTSDVYSLGATLFALLTGRPPFAAGEDEEIVALYLRIARDPVPDLRPGGVPGPLCAALERALGKRPDVRWASALDFGDALRAAERAAGVRVSDLPLMILASSSGEPADRPAAPDAATVTAPSAPSAPPAPPAPPRPTAPEPRARRTSRRVAVAAALVGAAALAATAVVLLHRNDSPPPRAAAAITLRDATRAIRVHARAGATTTLRIAGTAGQRLLVEVQASSAPPRPVVVAVENNGSTLQQSSLTAEDVRLDTVRFESSSTYTLVVGASSTAEDLTIRLALAPPDVQLHAAVGGGAVRIDLRRPRQLAYVTFIGRHGAVVRLAWQWIGDAPDYTSLGLTSPDGTQLSGTGWSALGAFRSPVLHLPADGTYTVQVSIDGDGTGSAELSVTAG